MANDFKIDFNKYIDIFPYIVVVLDDAGKIYFINEKGAEILDYKKEDILNKNWFDNFIAPEEEAEMSYVFENLKNGSRDEFKIVDNFVLNSKKEKILVRWRNIPLKDAAAGFSGVISFGYDMSEQKKYEKVSKLTEERFRKVIGALLDPLIIINSDELITYWNGAAEKMFDYRAGEIVGENFNKLLSSKEYNKEYFAGLEEFFKASQDSVSNKVSELEVLDKHGNKIAVDISTNSLILDDKISVVVSMRDLTEKKRAEQELNEKVNELQRFNKLMVGRELKMIELKEELKKCKNTLPDSGKQQL